LKTVILAAVVLLAGCSATLPVAVIAPDGSVLRGLNTFSLGSGTFSVSKASLECHGSYDATAHGPTISIAAICSDGRRGIGRAVRDGPFSGSGKITMTDGSVATFVYGAAAEGL